MQESFDLSHRETQTALPGPLEKAGLWDKLGTWRLPASSLSLASAFVFIVTLLFLRRNQEMQSLFMLPRWAGLLAAAVAIGSWAIVVVCSRRPGRLGPRLWALSLAVLNSVFLVLLLFFPEVTWINAVSAAGAAAALTLLPRLLRLPPDSAMIPRIAPLTGLSVLLIVLPLVGWVGESIAASKRDRVSAMIEELREWTVEVKAVTSRDWSGGGWDDASRAVGKLEQIQPAGKLDMSLWREAFSLGRDADLAEEVGHLLDATVAGFDPRGALPRVSRLKNPAFYYDGETGTWEESSDFKKASETTGLYYRELGRIFQDLDVQDSFAESQALETFKEHYLKKRSDLEAHLRPQMADWTDHWAVFRIPGRESLLGYSEMPLGKLLQSPLPALETPAADLPDLLELSYRSVRDLGRIPGCRPLDPYPETRADGTRYQYSRLDCYSYSPQTEGLGADPRVEMRLVYRSRPNGGLQSDQEPAEIYYLFPLPEGENEGEFQKQVMSDLAEAVRETTDQEVSPINRSNAVESGFRIRDKGRTIVVYKPLFIPLYGDRKGLQVRAERTI